MNSAMFESSTRLQKVYKVLADCLPHSTMDIIQKANVCAVNSIIAELRENGFSIKCHRDRNIWFYQMRKE